MIELFKLSGLPDSQKVRKIIKILEILEDEYVRYGAAFFTHSDYDLFYIEGLLRIIAEMHPTNETITAAVHLFFGVDGTAHYRTVFNSLRHALYQLTGVLPSEWDLISPGTRYSVQKNTDSFPSSRSFFPGVYVYAEDIRAPFNLGSLFRTAEAFGVDTFFLSEHCVSPDQPRARRSAMGCIDFLPWSHTTLSSLPDAVPIFALETGGTDISVFNFPPQGVVLIGSEELGLSAAALQKADAGIVSIPMKGIKASLNVAVAFGILMQYWTQRLNTCCLTESHTPTPC